MAPERGEPGKGSGEEEKGRGMGKLLPPDV